MCDFTVIGHEFTFFTNARMQTIEVRCKSLPGVRWSFDYNYHTIIDFMWRDPKVRLLLMRSTLL